MGRESRRRKEKRESLVQKHEPETQVVKGDSFERTRVVTEQRIQTGPIPSPETLAEYGQVIPGLPEKIISWTTDEGEHRRSLEKQAAEDNSLWIKEEISFGKRAQCFGVILGLSMIGGGLLIALKLETTTAVVSGAALGFAGLASLVWGPKNGSTDRDSNAN